MLENLCFTCFFQLFTLSLDCDLNMDCLYTMVAQVITRMSSLVVNVTLSQIEDSIVTPHIKSELIKGLYEFDIFMASLY